VLTDCWTSLGVVGGLCLVLVTGLAPVRPIVAIAVALNIICRRAPHVPLDRRADGLRRPRADRQVQAAIEPLAATSASPPRPPRAPHRYRTLVEVHLLFPSP